MVRALNLYLVAAPGWRRYLVIQSGKTKARLVSLETAEAFTVTSLAVAVEPKLEIQLQPRRMSKRLRAVAKTYGREDTAAVKLALKLLKEAKDA